MRFTLGISFLALALPAFGQQPSLRERGDITIHARHILKKYCSECHKGPETSFDVMDIGQLRRGLAVPWFKPNEPEHSQALEFIRDGSMPPGGRERPTELEFNVLREWVKLSMPQYPRAFDDDYASLHAGDDWRKQKNRDQVRYISLGPRVRDNQPFKSLKDDEDHLQAALDAATVKERATPLQHVDPAGTVFRIDIEKLGWGAKGYFWEVSPQGAPENPSQLLPYDLIRLENPYPGKNDGEFAKYGPVLRGDWLMEALAPGTPLAADLRALVELQNPGDTPCGPKVRAFEKPKFKLESPVNPPITSWYGPDRANPFELTFRVKGKPDATIAVGEEFTFEAVSRTGAKFLLLQMLSDGSIRPLPVAGGEVLKAGEIREIGPQNGKGFKVTGGISGEKTFVQRYILLAGPLPDGVPILTFLRTEHQTIKCPSGTGPLTRVIFDEKKTDTSKLARSVIAVTFQSK